MTQTVSLRQSVPTSDESAEFIRRNPADSGDIVFSAPYGTAQDVAAAVAVASTAFESWSRLSPVARGRILLDAATILKRDAEIVARDLTREEGKLLSEARGEVARTIEILRFYGGIGWYPGGEVYSSSDEADAIRTQREPVGVVGLVTPWNFPLAIPAWKLCPALVAGCTVVIKPAQLTSLSAHHLDRVLLEAGVPDGVVNIVHGSGADAGQALVAHPGVAAISFTGSNDVGAQINKVCHERGARVQLEMGGKNALVISPSAPARAAAKIAAQGGFGLSGQACTATSRLIVLPGVDEQFLSALREEARAYAPGDGRTLGSGMGPLVSEHHAEGVKHRIETAIAAGGTLLHGSYGQAKTFIAPHIFDDVAADDEIAQEEVFGPVVALVHVRDLEEALSVVNGTQYGLASGIVTAELREARHFAREARSGIVKINESTTGSAVNAPFGGVGKSSSNTFREQGYSALNFYTWTKTVYETDLWPIASDL